MFGDKKSLKDSERSLISETVSIDGTVNSSGAIDIAGLVKGNIIFQNILNSEAPSILAASISSWGNAFMKFLIKSVQKPVWKATWNNTNPVMVL